MQKEKNGKLVIVSNKKIGIINKITMLVFLFGFIVFAGVFLFIFMNIGENYFDKRIFFAAAIFLFIYYFSLSGLKKISRKNRVFCNLIQDYVEKSEETESGFLSPRKNVLKSTSYQTEHVKKIAESMTEINTIIERTKEQIYECNVIISTAKDKFNLGHAVMKSLQSCMQDIKLATSDMDMALKIINDISIKSSVITEIVAKTELLAMNASIEAARAGDFGKGFSVVSEEVGDLAKNSGSSAKKIKDLLNQSAMKVAQVIRATDERVKEGEATCAKVLRSFSEIGEGIRGLEIQADQILTDIQTQSEAMLSTAKVVERVTAAIGNSSVNISNSNQQLDTLVGMNDTLYALAEDLQGLVSGGIAAERMKKNRHNKIRRAIQEMNF